LSTEGLPEYSDVAALFQLIEDVADIDQKRPRQKDVTVIPSRPQVPRKFIAKDKAPVWPPQPMHADLA